MFKAVVLFALFVAVVAQAQNYVKPPHFNHVVIIVQENRTPDNLFGAGAGPQATCGSEHQFEPGVDIDNGGPNLASKNNGGPYITCTQPVGNLLTGGGSHNHQGPGPNAGWVADCDADSSGRCRMDGFCLDSGDWPNCIGYEYVTRSTVQPYFDIATNYGFANYMFQTHQGPSFEAHQFLFGGTSAPVFPGDPNNYYQDFVAENASFYDSGCPVTNQGPKWIDPGGNELGSKVSSECYDHNTLVTYQDPSTGLVHDRGVSWTYYTPDDVGIIWNAPGANPQTCYSAKTGSGPCGGAEWGHVSVAKTDYRKSVPILNDIAACNLSAISWAIPDEIWSDHPGFRDNSSGPSYVADIVDAIGNSTCTDNGQTYWQDTAIFITWDDWGGFYDHVPPPVTYTAKNGLPCSDAFAPNGWGCGYVYGFRVPLLVVSAYHFRSDLGAAYLPAGPMLDARFRQHFEVH
jgi:phospholipase C